MMPRVKLSHKIHIQLYFLSALSSRWNSLAVVHVLHHVYCINKQVTKIMKLNMYTESLYNS